MKCFAPRASLVLFRADVLQLYPIKQLLIYIFTDKKTGKIDYHINYHVYLCS